jgi:hypothetical protein
LLDTLLRQENADEAAAGSNKAYKLTFMKKLSQSTKPAKVKERVADLQLVEASYQLLKPVLDHLTLGQDGIQYYAYRRHQSPDLSADPTHRAGTVSASHCLYRASILSIGCTTTWSMSS